MSEAMFAPVELDPATTRLGEWRRVQQLLDRAELASGRARAEFRDAAASALRLMTSWERYWVYPGPARLARLHAELRAGRVVTAGALVRHLVPLIERVGDRATLYDDQDGWRAQRYLSVLVIHTAADLLAPTLGRALQPLKRPTDRCRYALLPVDSVEDALCAVSANLAIGACLVGNDVGWRAARRPPFAAPFFAANEVPTAPLEWLETRLGRLRNELVRLPLETPLPELHQRLEQA